MELASTVPASSRYLLADATQEIVLLLSWQKLEEVHEPEILALVRRFENVTS